jgi:hypothetical protein
MKSCAAPSAGSGVNLMPTNPNTSWWNPTLWKTDPLYNEIAFGASGKEFFLGHHTFTHENLNNVTYYDAEQQIRLNQVRCLLPHPSCRQPTELAGTWCTVLCSRCQVHLGLIPTQSTGSSTFLICWTRDSHTLQ